MFKEIEAKSIIRKYKRIDSWFVSCYGMNLYRGCSHNCVYCDGRTEKYCVDGEFGKDISVKTNAIEILDRELDPKRKRVPFKPCFMMIGGGVGDVYQPAEKKYLLTRKTLELMEKYNFPIHILTKSILVKRDLDIIKRINEKQGAIVSMSFSSVSKKISSIFEPGVPEPAERLETIKLFKQNNIPCGMFLMPVLPFITDTREFIRDAVNKANDAGIDFIIFSGMTLKPGRHENYFLNVLNSHYPDLSDKYNKIYKFAGKWGHAENNYSNSINMIFMEELYKSNIKPRIPEYLFKRILNKKDYVNVILDQIDYLLKIRDEKSYFGYSSYLLSQNKTFLPENKQELMKMLSKVSPGHREKSVNIILEILKTGKCDLYNKLMRIN